MTEPSKRIGPYKTLIIDSLTNVFLTWKDLIQFTCKVPELRIGDYRTLEGMLFSQFIPTLKSLNQMIPWILLLDHEMVDVDKDGAVLKQYSRGPSHNMGKDLSGAFDEIWRQTTNGETYTWKTRQHGLFRGAGTRTNLTKEVSPATYQRLKELAPDANSALALLVGEPKTGKTVSAATFPKPALFLDWDLGFKSVLTTEDKAGKLVVPDYDQISITNFIRSTHHKLEVTPAAKADFTANKFPPHTASAVEFVKKYNEVIDELYKDGCLPVDMIDGGLK